MKYRKKPVVIEAIQYAWSSEEDLYKGITKEEIQDEISDFVGSNLELFGSGDDMVIETLEGEMIARPGDWIIKGVNGEFYPCKPDIFEKTYERVED